MNATPVTHEIGQAPSDLPDEHVGVPTGVLQYEPPQDPVDVLFGEIWARRRGILQITSIVVGGACVAASAGTATAACVTAGYALATANVAQSAEDNLFSEDGCVSDFFVDAVANSLSLGTARSAMGAVDDIEEAAGGLAMGGALASSGTTSMVNFCSEPG